MLFPLLVNAQNNDTTEKPQSEQTSASSSVLYYRDPETGQLTTPPAEFTRSIQQDSRQFSTEGLQMVVLPDGTKMVDLQNRFQMSSVVVTDADGNLDHHCTAHPEKLSAAEHAALHPVKSEQ